MRVYAVSDIHVDFNENRQWLMNLSAQDYRDDILILAGDISDVTPFLLQTFDALKLRFREVLFVPGNHDLWTYRNNTSDSLAYFSLIQRAVHEHGILMEPYTNGPLTIIPLFGWYDYSFGLPSDELSFMWMDYTACVWPEHFDEMAITRHFISMNEGCCALTNERVITFSHFMPRIDLMPSIIPVKKRVLYPVLGTSLLEEQIRRIGPEIHVYGHTHVNRCVIKNGILYINNAFGYPRETSITRKKLLCVMEL